MGARMLGCILVSLLLSLLSSNIFMYFYEGCTCYFQFSFVYKDIGMSVRRSSRSAFGRSSGNDVSGHYKHHYFLFYLLFLARAGGVPGSAFGRSTAGNDVVATIIISLFSFFFLFFSPVFFLRRDLFHRRSARIKKHI